MKICSKTCIVNLLANKQPGQQLGEIWGLVVVDVGAVLKRGGVAQKTRNNYATMNEHRVIPGIDE